MASLKGSKAGVLFQNAEGNINMGVWFDDPDIEMEDNLFIGTIFWQRKSKNLYSKTKD